MLTSETGPSTYLDLSPYLKKPNLRLPNLNSNVDKMVARRTRSTAILKSANPLLVVKSTSDYPPNKQPDSGTKTLPEAETMDDTNHDNTLNNSTSSPIKRQKESHSVEKHTVFTLPRPLKTNFKIGAVTKTPTNSNSKSLNKTDAKTLGWRPEHDPSSENNQTNFIQANVKFEDYLSSFDAEATPTIKGSHNITTPNKNSRLKSNVLPILTPSNSTNQLLPQELRTPIKNKGFTQSNSHLKSGIKLNYTISEGEKATQISVSKNDDSIIDSPGKLQKLSEKKLPNARVKILRKAIQGSHNHLSFDNNITFTTPSFLNTSIKADSPMKQQRVENRTVYSYGHKTRAGKLPGRPLKPNQDSFITYTNFCGHADKFFFGVCDGHGVNGHLVSNFIKTTLPKNLENQYRASSNKDTSTLNNIIKQAFIKTDKQLSNSSIDSYFSGSTTVSVMILGTHLWCANVGDSRAILAKFKEDGWSVHPLSNDHKPGVGAEHERILKCGGRVEPYKDGNGGFIGPDRVWLKNENIPGLAMSRSMGDHVASGVGVIAEPEIIDMELNVEDKFVIIASDGLWEFLSNQQVMDIFRPYYLKNQLDLGLNALVRKAVECWNKLDDMIDDITCVAISLKVPQKSELTE